MDLGDAAAAVARVLDGGALGELREVGARLHHLDDGLEQARREVGDRARRRLRLLVDREEGEQLGVVRVVKLLDRLELRLHLLELGVDLRDAVGHVGMDRRRGAARVGQHDDRLALERDRLDGRERAGAALHDELHDRHVLRVGDRRLEVRAQRNLGAPRRAARPAVVDEDEVRVVRVERRAAARGGRARVARDAADGGVEAVAAVGDAPREDADQRQLDVLLRDGLPHEPHHAGVAARGHEPRLGGGRRGGQAAVEGRLSDGGTDAMFRQL